MKIRSGVLLVIALAGSVAAVGAAKQWEHDSRGVLAAIARAPLSARTQQNPYQNNPDAILAGAKLFRQHCAECHGHDGRGRSKAADLRAPDVQRATPGEIEWLLRNGNLARGMPSWSGLSAQRRWQIVAYIRTLD